MMLDLLYLDNHLLVVNKPAGLLSQADRTGDEDVLSISKKYLKRRFNKPGAVYLGLVQRLDRPVSGVMALARTSKAAARLTDQFKHHTTEKIYLALIEGRLANEGVCVDHLLKEDRRVRVVDSRHPGSKRAELSWRRVGYGKGLSLVKVSLKTGRKHQIRIQLSHRGHPILGDLRYGAKREFDGRNLALHCLRLGLLHPTRREPMSWVARPPDTWGGHFRDEIQGLFAEEI